jgi:hypothetical protein
MSLTLGSKVTVDVGKPGTIGYKPGHTGTIIGFVIALDKPTPAEYGRNGSYEYQIGGDKYVYTADREISTHEIRQAKLKQE